VAAKEGGGEMGHENKSNSRVALGALSKYGILKFGCFWQNCICIAEWVLWARCQQTR